MCDPTVTVLDAHRRAVEEIVDGLDEQQWRRQVLPSGWSVLGMVEHLAWAMTMWNDGALHGRALQAPWSSGVGAGPFVSDHAVAEVLAFYRDAGDRLSESLRELPCDAVPKGELPPDLAPLATSVGAVAAHLLEEIARHAGHLDVARELLDGRTGLGER